MKGGDIRFAPLAHQTGRQHDQPTGRGRCRPLRRTLGGAAQAPTACSALHVDRCQPHGLFISLNPPGPVSAALAAPVAVPSQSPAALDHRAGKVARPRRDAPRRRPAAPGAAFGSAGQSRPSDKDVALRMDPCGLTNQPDKCVARLNPGGGWTRVIRAAAAIHFPGCYPGQADARSLGAPDRAVAIPHPGRRTGEVVARVVDGRRSKQDEGKYHRDLGVEAGSMPAATYS